MQKDEFKETHLKDYRVPDYLISSTKLNFDLYDDYTEVSSVIHVKRNNASASAGAALVLNGQDLELISVSLDNELLHQDRYSVDKNTLTIPNVPEQFKLTCITKIKPHQNTSLEGLYRSRSMYCTQCEAEGFRKITYYLDRPDVMSVFTTKISADKEKYPVLLSNGNLTAQGELPNGRHWVEWQDPSKKPAYLFALVAGDLVSIDDTFNTLSNKKVELKIFVEEKDRDKCDYAMQALKNAMLWDEQVYGREYDLDIFMIVAVDDFNMGAMENKGLNIFNTSCVLASAETTSDAGFKRVEGVVAHEYFHNWSGNRVTCRDWFQLSLKEGFTVFRDQTFSADMGSSTVKRVEDVAMLRTHQFAEDAGPMAHPVQPSTYLEISNFYTLTVYEKGAEIVRMLHTLLGPETFRKGSDLYFERHDGQAVTINDFVKAMSDVSGRDLEQFMRWYHQAGTPTLHASGHYDAAKKSYTLTVRQSSPAGSEKNDSLPYHIPLTMALLGQNGPLPLQTSEPDIQTEKEQSSLVLELTQSEQSFVFENVNEQVVPSLLRHFSAPVHLNYHYTRPDLLRIMAVDDDGFSRWDASQKLATAVIFDMMNALNSHPAPALDKHFIDVFQSVLNDRQLDPAMVALTLTLPSETYLAEQKTPVEVELIHHARKRVKQQLAKVLYSDFLRVYLACDIDEPYQPSAEQIARRSLKNLALDYLVTQGSEEALSLCERQFSHAGNMTDALSALRTLVHTASPALETLRQGALTRFYEQWQNEALVMNEWLAVQATRPVSSALTQVKALQQHPIYDPRNPNKLRALVGGFAMRNPINFHALDGSGYAFLADEVTRLDKENPQVAARLIKPLTSWKRYDEKRQQGMRAHLQKMADSGELSKDVYEVVSKSLV